MEENNMGYNLSLFEQSKKDNTSNNNSDKSHKKKRKRKSKRKKHNPLMIVLFILLSSLSLFVVSIMITNQIKIAEYTDNISKSEKLLAEEKSITTQLSIKIESKLSLDTVEKYAKENLNMRKIQPYQMEYVSIASKDNLDIIDDSNDSWIDKVRKVFLDFFA